MDPVTAVSTALGVIAQAIADARAANDDAAVATLEALVADSAVGRVIFERAVRAQGVIDAGRERVRVALEERDEVLDVARVVTAPLP